VTELGGSASLLGLVALTIWTGMLLPQVVCAKTFEGLPYKKPTVLFWGTVQRIGWLVLLLSMLVRWSPGFTLGALFVTLAIGSFGTGVIIPVWCDWYAKTTPEAIWGGVLGIRRVALALLGLGLGRFTTAVMLRFRTPARYEVLLSLAVAFYALSFLFTLQVWEQRQDAPPAHRGRTWRQYFRDLRGILLGRRDFRLFLAASVLVTFPLTVMATYLTRHGLDYPGAPEGITGAFTTYHFVGIGLGALVGGLLSDRAGTLGPFRIFPLPFIAAAALASLSAAPGPVCAAFGLLGLARGAQMVVVLPAVLRFAGPHRRASYSALSFTVLGAANAALPPLMGLLHDAGWMPFARMFLLCALAAAVGWAMFLPMGQPHGHDC